MRFLWCLLFVGFIAFSAAREQTVKVQGQLFCHGRESPARNTLVQLREKDLFDPDDTLDSVYTGLDGKFRLTGTHDEFTTISPYVRITHTCDVQNRGSCHRIADIPVPETFINNGTYELPQVNLNLQKFKEICN